MKTLRILLSALTALGGITDAAVLNADAQGRVQPMREAVMERDYRQIVDMVRSAVQERLNQHAAPDRRVWPSLAGVFDTHVVVDVDGKLWRYDYQLKADASGAERVELGEAVAVAVTFVPVKDLGSMPGDGSSGAAPAKGAGRAVREAGAQVLAGEPAGNAGSSVDFSSACSGSFLREAVSGKGIECTLIRSGLSKNGNLYPASVLERDVALFEGVRVFVKSDADHVQGGGKAVSNLLGDITGVRFVQGASPDEGSLVGLFRPIDATDPTVAKVREALKNGQGHLMGLSIDAVAKTKTVRHQRGGQAVSVREATAFRRVNSVDLIVEPGAGGSLDRLVEASADAAESVTNLGSTMKLKQKLFEQIRAKNAAAAAKVDLNTISDEELVSLHEAVCGPASAAGAEHLREAAGGQGDDAPVTQAQLRVMTARGAAALRVDASKLPDAAKMRLKLGLADTTDTQRLTEAAVDAAIQAEADYLGQVSGLREAGHARVPQFGAGSIVMGDRRAVVADMWDAFFDKSHKDHRSVRSVREAYIATTGDRYVTGQLDDCDQSLLRESVGSGTFANSLGSAITRQVQRMYVGESDLDVYKRVVTLGTANDFRLQERTRIGGYGNLPVVAEGANYALATSPSDERATYSMAKRGVLEDVTLEAITNDDVNAIRRIPAEMNLAAKNTLHEFVFDFFRLNPVIYDGLALYHASHGNLFTGALSAAEFSAHRLAMVKQVRAGSGKRLGAGPAMLLVPADLQEMAFNLFVRNQNIEKTFVQSINPVVVPIEYWTDTNDWVAVANPERLPCIELSFLGGNEMPAVFAQDTPNVGSLFNADKLTYKIRHIYGGNVLVDGFKATTKAVVP